MTRQFSLFLILLVVSFLSCENQNQKSSANKPEYVLVIHGGAGTILKKNMTAEKEAAYLNKLEEVLLSGKKYSKTEEAV